MIAILPAAGKGTRMAALTGGSKELLPVGGKPVLQWVIEEARQAGADRVVAVVSPQKPDLAAVCADIETVTQEVATGLAPATVLAAHLGPALLLLPDTIFFLRSPASRLVQALSRGFDFAIAVQKVSEDQVSRYGIVEWSPENGRISRILEKPSPDQTPSRWAIAARFGLSTRSLFFVKEQVEKLRAASAEIDLPPLFNQAILAGHTALAIPLEEGEVRLDCGNPDGYRRACEVVDASL